MKQKKAAVPTEAEKVTAPEQEEVQFMHKLKRTKFDGRLGAPMYEEVCSFMPPVEVEVNQVSRALALAANHEGDAKTYLCKIGSRDVKVKVWTVTT